MAYFSVEPPDHAEPAPARLRDVDPLPELAL
jgi:adenylate cyclase